MPEWLIFAVQIVVVVNGFNIAFECALKKRSALFSVMLTGSILVLASAVKTLITH